MNILITGTGRGIGAGLAAAFRARGDRVTGTRRTGAGPDDLPMDLRDPASIRAAATAYGARPLDLLVCCAGVYPESRSEPLDTGYAPGLWAEGFAVNVTGAFLTVQAFLTNLRRAAAPKIAFIASQMGSSARAPGGSYIYRASKAAMINLGRNLAADLGPEGIALGIYHPGWVRTDMGGPGADIGVAEAIPALLARLDALSLSTSGTFEGWDGKPRAF